MILFKEFSDLKCEYSIKIFETNFVVNKNGKVMNLIYKMTSRVSTSQYGYDKKEIELYPDKLIVTSESHYGVIGKAIQKSYSLTLIKSMVFESKKILRVELEANETNDFELKFSSTEEEINNLVKNLKNLNSKILLDDSQKERHFSQQELIIFIAIGAMVIFSLILGLVVKFSQN